MVNNITRKPKTNNWLPIFLFLLCFWATSSVVNAQILDDLKLKPLGTYETGIFDDGGSEIPSYDPSTQRLFITNGANGVVDVIDISDPTNPTKLFELSVSDAVPDGSITSIAVSGGIVGVTVDRDTEKGKVVFFAADAASAEVDPLAVVEVGYLPDMLIFTPDASKVLVANEGEPKNDGTDFPGSVSIITISDYSVEEAEFTAFDGREDELRARGVRIFTTDTVSKDVEPEGIAISPDGSTAFISLQENNAFGILDIATATITDILPLGYKDHSKSQPVLKTFEIDEEPYIEDSVLFGGLSALYYQGMNEAGNYVFVTVPDRGPNGDPTALTRVSDDAEVTGRPFLLPDYQAKIYKLELDMNAGEVNVIDTIYLTRTEGEETFPISGLPNLPGVDEYPVVPVAADGTFVDGEGNQFDSLEYDPYGGDLEGIVINPTDDTYWMVDEYRPAIYHFDTDGVLIDRFIPEGTAAQIGEDAGTFGSETLPEVYLNRRSNRGFEAIALDTDSSIVYAFIQTPMNNPDRATGDASSIIRILGINPEDGTPVSEYVYLLEKPSFRGSNVDKIGDAVYNPEKGTFYVMERDSGLDPSAKKFIFEVDLKGATNILGLDIPTLTGKTLEAHTPDEMMDAGISPVHKTKILNLPSIGYLPSDKPEGLALMPNGNLAVINDNDFGLVEGAEAIELGIIEFNGRSNALDASDRDETINIANWPVLGMYQPDGVVGVELDGNAYYVTANEGDAREYDFFAEEERVKDLDLDADAFPNASELQADYNLGRLTVSAVDGDIDGDGDYDQLYVYGGRSFAIWDEYGNLVFESGDEFEKITAKLLPEEFNDTNDENGSFDNRSDNKGPEPEGVAIGVFNGKTYAFIGLERIGGIMVYDISDPYNAKYEGYFTNRDFTGDAEAGTAGDLAPEGLLYITAENSPNGEPLLVVANEVSGSTTIFGAATAYDEEYSSVQPIEVSFSGRYATGLGSTNAEIVAVDTNTNIMFVLNSTEVRVDRVDIQDISSPDLIGSVSLTEYGSGIQSVAVSDIGLVAVAVAAEEKVDNGLVYFMDTDGTFVDTVYVGALPDMVAFTPDGSKLLVANEGEPNDDYTVDPEGTVSIIDVSNGLAGDFTVTTAGFTDYNEDKEALIEAGIRVFGPDATVAQDFEPEYITFNGDGSIAYVSLQENNAIAMLDIASATFTDLLPLGYKDYNKKGNAIDASNEDGGINIQNWPVYGMYQPDAIKAYEIGGKSYIFTANEGDSRDYDGFSEEDRIKDLELDPVAFPNAAELQKDENLGRLNITTTLGDIDGDGDYDELYSYGARSFSIWDSETGEMVFDSGDDFEQLSAVLAPELFNSNRGGDSPDSRSDDKAAEPEAIAVGEVDGRIYAFIGLERQGHLRSWYELCE